VKANTEFIKSAFETQKVLIIGDVMIDSYIWGKVDRISPEAPVPIVNVKTREQRLGGAANVALNIQSLGAEPILCAVVGNDSDGSAFLELIKSKQLSTEGIISSAHRITTIKHRIISGSQHILRVDQEIDTPISSEETILLIEKINAIIKKHKIDVVIFEDYDKGVITEKLITETVSTCKDKNIPVIVDPKKRNFLAYKNVTLFKPNLKELRDGLKKEINPSQINEVKEAVEELIQILNANAAFITLSEHGVYLQDQEVSHHVKAHKREIADVSGAGDTVVSVAALCLGAGLDHKLLAELSNLAGGIVCEKVGVVPINITELTDEAVSLGIIS
jgi:D-glycero-beta-D-manno-heptose-7-phosphate kinase